MISLSKKESVFALIIHSYFFPFHPICFGDQCSSCFAFAEKVCMRHDLFSCWYLAICIIINYVVFFS